MALGGQCPRTGAMQKGLTFSCPMQVHQSAKALRWIMQALQGNGFTSEEDMPLLGKYSWLHCSSTGGSPGPALGPVPASRLEPSLEPMAEAFHCSMAQRRLLSLLILPEGMPRGQTHWEHQQILSCTDSASLLAEPQPSAPVLLRLSTPLCRVSLSLSTLQPPAEPQR